MAYKPADIWFSEIKFRLKPAYKNTQFLPTSSPVTKEHHSLAAYGLRCLTIYCVMVLHLGRVVVWGAREIGCLAFSINGLLTQAIYGRPCAFISTPPAVVAGK
jgi:hypothetical protein